MKRLVVLYCLLFLLVVGSMAQTTADYAVLVSAIAQTSPSQITLHWPSDPNATGYTIFRKAKGTLSWGSTFATLAGSDTSFIDTSVAVGQAWEYRIFKAAGAYTGNGYIYAGIELPAQEYYGKVILVLDSTYKDSLTAELARLEEDLWGDGWQVIRIDVARTDAVAYVKTLIQTEWQADPTRVRAVFLLGHVPVPYSGNLNPDGHGDHIGAWPADVFYGEMDGVWTDASINNTTASRTANHNVPGDGKYDQTIIPSDAELEVGRVDFANMPSFAIGELGLLRRYLQKDHDWRHKVFTVPELAVVDDNFGVFSGEIFATSGWRNFAPLVGAGNVSANDFRGSLNAQDHLWAYGCGGGWYQGAGGIGSTTDFAGDSLRGVFTMIFGSYHGDWDSDDNFMRAALASKGHVLSTSWSGRPHWHYQHMGLGEPIGFSARLTQNNSTSYFANYGGRFIHIALMGDPTVRMHVVAPPSNLAIVTVNNGSAHELTWTASPESVLGYSIYRQDTVDGRFWGIGQTSNNITTFTDSCKMAGDYQYMVRAMELRTGQSGTYYNLSQGILGRITNTAVFSIITMVSSPAVYCPGDSISVSFITDADFCDGNVFEAQFSDAQGFWISPTTIASIMGTSSNTIHGVVPNTIPPGTGYRVRVTATNPFDNMSDNGIDLTVSEMPNASFTAQQNGLTVTTSNASMGATHFLWYFGDGDTSTLASPSHQYASDGTYILQLIASNACGSDTFELPQTLVGMEESQALQFNISPNPAENWFEINPLRKQVGNLQVDVFDAVGNKVFVSALNGGLRIDTHDWARGMYVVVVEGQAGRLCRRMALQ